MKKPELLAPAGNIEKLKIAVRYGADAVYLGGESFGLRSMAGNFTIDAMHGALEFCHANGVKAYLTLNSYPADSLLPSLNNYIEQIRDLPFDAYIVADPGVIRMARRMAPDMELHLSTQANCINHEAAAFWKDQGIARINLAREMTLEDIKRTTSNVDIPCEVFIHGALCVAYSGRCLISSALTGRSANMGSCTQPCRWKYNLVEETRPGEFMPVEEDENGTLIFNSRDLCLLEYLPELVSAGVAAMKIEGRMKGIHYLAGVLRVYRAAIDTCCKDPDAYTPDPSWMEELTTVSHRGYTTGFLLGDPKDVGQSYGNSYQRSHQLVGVVEKTMPDGKALITVRNRFFSGDTLEITGPDMKTTSFKCGPIKLFGAEGEPEDCNVVHPNQRIIITVPQPAEEMYLLRTASTGPE